jgi:hypothetical protein
LVNKFYKSQPHHQYHQVNYKVYLLFLFAKIATIIDIMKGCSRIMYVVVGKRKRIRSDALLAFLGASVKGGEDL